VGTTECLLDDAIALARAAGLADVSVRLEVWPRMFHIWPNYHQVLAEGRQAIAGPESWCVKPWKRLRGGEG
jgi:acetyl esterase/lipase